MQTVDGSVYGGEIGRKTESPAAMCLNTLQRCYLQDNKLITSDLYPLTSTSSLPPILSADQCVHRLAVPDHPVSAEL